MVHARRARPSMSCLGESFSKGWATDITQHLRLEDVRVFDADFRGTTRPVLKSIATAT